MGEYHIPIMLDDAVGALNVQKDKLYFDGTLGGGGHSGEILRRGGSLLATDLDIEALEHCKSRFEKHTEYEGKYTLIQENFKNFKQITEKLKIDSIAGAILDLGISSHQIDTLGRGFAYIKDQELDMRMNQSQSLSAIDVVNEYSEQELVKILYTYGEERFAKRIARNIVESRKNNRITTTGQLAELVIRSVPKGLDGGHPAKKTFQAIRIEVNSELESLDVALRDIFGKLEEGGRLAVICFHSLESIIVKKVYNDLSVGCICDKSLPICVCKHVQEGKIIAKKMMASKSEQESNSRSKSATLRIIEKLRIENK